MDPTHPTPLKDGIFLPKHFGVVSFTLYMYSVWYIWLATGGLCEYNSRGMCSYQCAFRLRAIAVCVLLDTDKLDLDRT